MKERFKEKILKDSSLEVVEQANLILDDYQNQGFTLTVRQLYYQFVSMGLIENSQRSYKRLSNIIDDGRLVGLIDWDAIEDRGRMLRGQYHVTGPSEQLKEASTRHHIDKWEGQEYRPEVWIEKEALLGVIEDTCWKLDVDYFACKGYNSQSEMYVAGQRFQEYISNGQTPVIIHLGDHDPSGIDMTRDIKERVSMFSYDDIDVERIALNMDQVQQYNPPPNPAKSTDSRFANYIHEYGRKSWELDALKPSVIAALIRKTILQYCDIDMWNDRLRQENLESIQLRQVGENWEAVQEFLMEI